MKSIETIILLMDEHKALTEQLSRLLKNKSEMGCTGITFSLSYGASASTGSLKGNDLNHLLVNTAISWMTDRISYIESHLAEANKALSKALTTASNNLKTFEVRYYYLATGMEGMADEAIWGRYSAIDENDAIEMAIHEKYGGTTISDEAVHFVRGCLSAKLVGEV